ncbi:MerR family transcriptional regulator [Paenibacillus vulneris]|uniref:MerR family transcriptional regulator n=1 Tax=Paenibacillus vulneris TaxID=1133364 RepID=A0ABW3UP76_9BACL|nr:MerR family transcriptional regulator [Paenibacillus sp. 32352]
MKISQLSKATGVSARSIRYYEKQKLLTAKRLDNDYREFDEADIKRIKTIQIYLELGMSTKEILEILKCHEDLDAYDSDEFCEEMLGAYEEKHAEIVQQIQTMTMVQRKLEQRIEKMRGQKAMISTAIASAEQSSQTL